MASVIAFAGVSLGRADARALLGRAGVPWNLIPADLAGAAEGNPLPSGGPIRAGERLELVGFERASGAPAWFARVRRLDVDAQPEVIIPIGAAVKIGITTKAVQRRLDQQTDPQKLADEITRMERQAGLDRLRHRANVLSNIESWIRTNPLISIVALWVPTGLAALEEVWPGAVAQVAEDILDGVCGAPLTAAPAWMLGACKPSQTPWWVPWAVGAGVLIAVAVAVTSVRGLLPGRR